MAAGHAQQYSDALLAKRTRVVFLRPFTATKGQLCTLAAPAAALATIAAGINMRVHTSAHRRTGDLPRAQADLLIAGPEYDSDKRDAGRLTPLGPPSATYPEAQADQAGHRVLQQVTSTGRTTWPLPRALAAKAAAGSEGPGKAAAREAVMTLKARAKAHHTLSAPVDHAEGAEADQQDGKAARRRPRPERKAPTLPPRNASDHPTKTPSSGRHCPEEQIDASASQRIGYSGMWHTKRRAEVHQEMDVTHAELFQCWQYGWQRNAVIHARSCTTDPITCLPAAYSPRRRS